MLVLSRRWGQRIFFPRLNISVKVLPGNGSTVRLGIEAPPDVVVVREEIAAAAARNDDRHDLRGRLNSLAIALHIVEKQLKGGLIKDAEQTLQDAQNVLESVSTTLNKPSNLQRRDKHIEALLVEDDPNEEALLTSYLRLSGFQVSAVRDGYEALECLAGHQCPDFVLLDMRLPRFDGPATVQAIRQNPAYRNVKIFAVSGSMPSEYRLPVGSGGVDAWFQKPLNPKRIVEAMNTAVSRN